MKQPPIIEGEIGKRIKAFRNEKRLTLEKLAEQTGFSKGYLSKMEKSEKAPPVSTLGIIARALGVTISRLLGEESRPSPFHSSAKEKDPSSPGTGHVSTIPMRPWPTPSRTRSWNLSS